MSSHVQRLANCTTKDHAAENFAPSWAYDAVVDDEFDDDELLELAQAGRSQEEGPSSHHATDKSTHDTAPPQHAKATALDNNSGRVGSIAEPLKSPAADEQQPAGAYAAQDDYLELDDDELLELACTSMDPQQDDAQTAPGGVSTVSKSAGELSRSDPPGVPQPGSRETNLGESGALILELLRQHVDALQLKKELQPQLTGVWTLRGGLHAMSMHCVHAYAFQNS